MATITGEKYNSFSGAQKYDDQRRAINTSVEITYFLQGDSLDSPPSILATSGLPQIGDIFNGAPCKQREATEVDTAQHFWEVVCTFDNSSKPNDLYLSPRWSWDYETEEQVLQKDPVTGRAITNTMGERLFPSAPIAVAILNIEKFQQTFDPSTIFAYVNHTNSAMFWGAPRDHALMSGIRDDESGIEREDYPGLRYFRKVQYVVKFHMDSWILELLNTGTICHRLNPDEAKDAQSDASRKMVWACQDESGNPIERILDKDGYVLGAGPDSDAEAPDFDPVPTEPTLTNGGWQQFHKFPQTNFNALSLGPW